MATVGESDWVAMVIRGQRACRQIIIAVYYTAAHFRSPLLLPTLTITELECGMAATEILLQVCSRNTKKIVRLSACFYSRYIYTSLAFLPVLA